MHPKTPKWLDDIASASSFILQQASGRSLPDYEGNLLLRSAIERNVGIVGEALLRIERTDSATAARVSDYRKIIGFRNRLSHGYDDIDSRQVWDIIQYSLPALKAEVEQLLRETGDAG